MADAPPEGNAPPRPPPMEALKMHIMNNKVTFTLFFTRIAQIVFAIAFIIPFFGPPANMYHKALVSLAATSALRLHQRVPQLQLSRQFLASLLAEDACHYLLLALIMVYAAPSALPLIPPTLFAVLHAASYALRLLDIMTQIGTRGGRMLSLLVEKQSQNLLRAVALSEIALMPYTVLMVFTGRGSLLTPFMYYRFLSLRYTSQRNPYSRTMFHELRRGAEQQAASAGCPALLANLIHKAINLCLRLSPPAPAH